MKRKLITLITLTLCLVMTVSAVAAIFSSVADKTTPNLPLTSADDTVSSAPLSTVEDFISGTPVKTFDFSTNVALTRENNLTYSKGDGFYTFTASGSDPYVYFNEGKFTGAQYVTITYRASGVEGKRMQIYVGSYGSGPLNNSTGTMLEADIISDGEWNTMIFDTSSIASSKYDGKTVSYFRLDPLEGTIKAGQSVDVKSISFYATDAVDYEGYLDYLEYLDSCKYPVDWPDPTYTEMTTVPEDTKAGSLTYTPSEDGTKMTISYEVNGETRSYTVPNKLNYLFGGYVGTDDLGRELYTADDIRDASENTTIGVYDEENTPYVGLFYFLWLGEEGDNGIYDLQKIIDNNSPSDYQNANSGLYGGLYVHHWFAEPLYGYYYSKDAWVMRKHAELLCNAGIDFLYFDATNGKDYVNNALQLMSILHELNEQGFDAPQVVFYTNSSSSSVISNLYSTIYKPGLYEDTWFRLDGKPVIVGTEDKNSDYGRQNNGKFSTAIKNFFTIKESQWPNEELKENGWPWMDWEWPQRLFPNSDRTKSVINVSIAQHQGTVAFSTSAFYGDEYSGTKINRGRSFNARLSRATELNNYRATWQADPTLSYQGLNFQAQWDQAHKAAEKGDNLEIVLVTGWNEWVAQRIPGTVAEGKDSSFVYFVDTASVEYSRDAEMMRGGYFDNYYMQLVQNVEKLKGDAPVIVQDSRKPINVTGDFSQWEDVLVTYYDAKGDAVERNSLGFGHTLYTNTTARNDILTSKITHDTKNLYFYARTYYDVTMYDPESSWMQLFIDIDDNAKTGWYGYDYIINYTAKDTFTTTVAKYNGTDGEYSFEVVGEVSYRAKGKELMISVPMEMLGVTDYNKLNFQFKWADSTSTITTMEQFYTDGDVAPLGRLNYVFQNYIPTNAEADVPGNGNGDETNTETGNETESETVSETESVTETTAEAKKGCGSVIATTGSATLLVSAMAAAFVLKKKQN